MTERYTEMCDEMCYEDETMIEAMRGLVSFCLALFVE